MLRPLVAFAAIALAALVLAPTVASVGADLNALHIKRDNLIHLWKWVDPHSVQPPSSKCQQVSYQLESEVTLFPERLEKSQPYVIGGHVLEQKSKEPVPGDKVDVFLNETKSKPGVPLGSATTDAKGQWRLNGTLPFTLQAQHYHIVAHAQPKTVGCRDYLEHWSDPEMNVTARSTLALQGPWSSIAGQNVTLSGTLTDEVGGPIRHQQVALSFGGKSYNVNTDEEGRFALSIVPPALGTMKVRASFAGNVFYSASQAESELTVLDETVTLNGLFPKDTLQLYRSRPLALEGHVYLKANATPGPVKLTFSGVQVRACESCPAVTSLDATPTPEGLFSLKIVADGAQPPGKFTLSVTGGGLKKPAPFNGTLTIPTTLALQASEGGRGSKAYNGSATLSDDQGPMAGVPLAILTPTGWATGKTDAQGQLAFRGEASACGPADVTAYYNATEGRQPSVASQRVSICGATLAESTLGFLLPWWAWALLVLAPLAGWYAYHRLRHRYAATISDGPPLTLAFASPRDAASGIVSLGEAASLAAFLEAPLPEGYGLRMGSAERMEDVEPNGLEAQITLVADAWGEIPVRAEIVDPRGRVVTRRTRVLRVVKYAEEIERRYRALQADHERSGRVTPHEFEAWLRARHPSLDPAIARRLIHVFEEADYGPRSAGRPELIAFLEAESRVQEVAPLAIE